MNNKVAGQPTPYRANGQEFDQYSQQNQHGGQKNYEYSPNIPQQATYTAQSTSINKAIVTQVPGNAGQVYQSAPHDYSTQARIATALCFVPTGLLAMKKANESRAAMARGDMAGAHAAANSARRMVRISWVLGILSIVVVAVAFGVYYGLISY